MTTPAKPTPPPVQMPAKCPRCKGLTANGVPHCVRKDKSTCHWVNCRCGATFDNTSRFFYGKVK